MDRLKHQKQFTEFEPLLKIKKTNIDDYIDLMLKTRNMYLCNAIAYKLEKYNSESIKHALVKIIKRKSRIGRRARLIVICEKYDCSEYLNSFIDIALEEESESYIWAIDVIGQMKGPFIRRELERGLNKITQSINAIGSGEKQKLLVKLGKYLLKFQ